MVKKILKTVVLSTLLCVVATPVFATSEDAIRRDINDIKKRIEVLSRDIENIMTSEESVARFPNIPSTFRFTRQMGRGANGVDVRYMQIIFNADPVTRVATAGVKSRGQETNNFGSLTEDAVRRFQIKYAEEILHPWNITVPTGYVGRQTIIKLNQILAGEIIIRRIPEHEIEGLIKRIQDLLNDIMDIKRRLGEINESGLRAEVIAYGEIKLSWRDDRTDTYIWERRVADDYYICSRSTTASGSRTDVVAVKDMDSCVITGAIGKGRDYYVSLDAVDINGERERVGTVGPVKMTRDPAPYNIVIEREGLGLKLKWETDQSSIQGYQIWRAHALDGSGDNYIPIATIGGGSREYTDNTIGTYTFYNYKVRQYTGGSWSSLEDVGPRMRSWNGARLGEEIGQGEVCPNPALIDNNQRRKFIEEPPNC